MRKTGFHVRIPNIVWRHSDRLVDVTVPITSLFHGHGWTAIVAVSSVDELLRLGVERLDDWYTCVSRVVETGESVTASRPSLARRVVASARRTRCRQPQRGDRHKR